MLVLAVSQAGNPLFGLIYVLLFGLGSMIGMGALSAVIAFPLAMLARYLVWANRGLQVVGTDISSSVAPRHVPTNVAQVIAVIMVVLALVGAGITLTNAAWAEKYWLILVPTYGLLCTFAAWYHARALDRMVARQICTGPVSALRWRWTLPYCEAVVSRPQRQRD